MGRHKRMTQNQPGREILGRRLRAIRRQRGLNLTALGRATGLSHSFLSQVENGHTFPSVSTLWQIADALDATPAELLTETAGGEPFVVHTGEGRILAPADDLPDVVVRARSGAHHLKAATVRGRFEATSTMAHDGEELLYVIAGSLELTIEDTPIVLAAGDSVVFDSSRPHRYRSLTGEDAHLFFVTVQPGASAQPFADDEFARRRAADQPTLQHVN